VERCRLTQAPIAIQAPCVTGTAATKPAPTMSSVYVRDGGELALNASQIVAGGGAVERVCNST
jgi:hypothetical protein